MPRIYDEDNNALDFCRWCFPDKDEAFDRYGEAGKNSHNEDHPDYDDTDYRCEDCKKKLTSHDNKPL